MIIDDTQGFEDEPRIYGNISPCLRSARSGLKVIDEVKELGFMDNGTQQIKVLTEQSIVAMRGRNPENPSDRTVGAPTEQRLGPNSHGICNTLTSVTKDNLVMETKVINPLKGLSDNGWHFEQNVYDSDGIVRSVKAGGGSGNIPKVIETQYRIRKLTPRECYRLMAVPEKDIDKMLEVNSNTQCYKQAGNSIVVNCLIAIFSQMGIQGIPRWNDGLSEKYK